MFGVLNFSKIAISRLSSAKTKIKELELPYTRVGPQQLDQVLIVCRMTFLRFLIWLESLEFVFADVNVPSSEKSEIR